MKKNKQKIDLGVRKFEILPAPVRPIKFKRKGMEMMVKEAILFSKNGSSLKEISNWIKYKHNVEPKHFIKLIRKTLKILVKLKIVYIHKQKPKRYKLTPNGIKLKQSLRNKKQKSKSKKKNTKDKNLPIKVKRKRSSSRPLRGTRIAKCF